MRSGNGARMATTLSLMAVLSLACSSTPAVRMPAYEGSVTGYGYTDIEALGAEEISALGADGGTSFESSRPAARILIRSGQITVAVDDLEAAMAEVERIVDDGGGYVEQSNAAKDSDVSIYCRVPSARLEESMDAIAGLGDEKDRALSARDVTDEYLDLEARLKSGHALRDRLQALLDRATEVEDVLAIEKELTRVQNEVESMQGRLDRLGSHVELAPLVVLLQRERILGPLGYVGYGLWWAVSKLFVIQ